LTHLDRQVGKRHQRGYGGDKLTDTAKLIDCHLNPPFNWTLNN
jgi:hypothetical protein